MQFSLRFQKPLVKVGGPRPYDCVRGVVIYSVLSCCSKNLKWRMNRCYSSVLYLSFIWQAKKNTFSRHEGRLTQNTSWLNFGSSYDIFSSIPLEPLLHKLVWPRGLFVSPEVPTLVSRPSFVPFSWASPFVF